MEQSEKTLDMIVNLCKNRGYVFPGSEIYGGLANSWDYGPLGVEFKNNVKKAWLKKFVQESPYNVGLDAAIIMNPQTWVTTGHVSSFSDPLLDCRACKARHRADKLIGEEHPEVNVDAMSFDEMDAFIAEHEDIVCPVCGKPLTVGVLHRVLALADRTEPPCPGKDFQSLIPLPEILGEILHCGSKTRKVQEKYADMLDRFGSEMTILQDVPEDDLRRAWPELGEAVSRMRAGRVIRHAGYDGEYGTIRLFEEEENAPSLLERVPAARRTPLKKNAEKAQKKNLNTAQAEKHPAETPAAPKKNAAPFSLESFSPMQKEALEAGPGPVLVLAGPGAGKTRTLVGRLVRLLSSGTPASDIVAITFTRRAAEEMRTRLAAALQGAEGNDAALPETDTLHALALKHWPGEAPVVLSEEGARKAFASANPALDKKEASKLYDRLELGRETLNIPEALAPLAERYRQWKKERHLADYTDLPETWLAELRSRNYGASKPWKHILVDEVQDLSPLQKALVEALTPADGSGFFGIGDPDQSIYGFRGADCRCFQRLQEEHPGVKEIHLTENYRSAPAILDTALAVIGHNPGGGRILTPRCPAGPAVRLVQAADSFSEAVFIAKEIGRMTGGVDMLEAQALGHERTVRAFSDIAVLCRTHRQLELVEKCLRHDDIPCLVTGREDFLDDPAVRGALGFLRSLVVPADNAALESALRLLWNCPADLIQKAQTLCQKMGTLDSAALQEAVRGHGILENWLGRAEVWLPLVRTETPRKLVEQWEEQYGTSPALERLRNTAVFHEDFDSLWNALVLGQEADLRRASGKHWASGAVRLMTLHGAKGLEFPAVFLAGLSAGGMPLKSPGRPADVEEERRLFFVGLTRAREELILTAAPEFSPFLRELPETVVRETTGRRREAEQLRLF